MAIYTKRYKIKNFIKLNARDLVIMKSKNYWSQYNKDLLDLSNKILKYNNEHYFNYVEESFYNHVRDILSLVILKLSNGKPLKILDYGSNILTWSNLKNKIAMDNVQVSIYDPFYYKKYEEINKNIEISSSFKLIKQSLFDLTIFGSSSQYIENFYDLLKENKEILSKNILFTHTPFSIKENFKSSQFTGYKGIQNIRSINLLKEFFFNRNYEIVFKSVINKNYASVEEKYFNQTIYANILFSKF